MGKVAVAALAISFCLITPATPQTAQIDSLQLAREE